MKIMKKIIKKIFEKIQSGIFFSIGVFLVLGVTYAYTSITNVSNGGTLTATKFNQIIAGVNDAGTFRDTVDNTTCDYGIKSISNTGTVTCKDYDTCGGVVSAGGYTYNTKRGIDGNCWTAENMKHVPSSGYSWCYDDNSSNCDSDGRLYDWDAAMGGGTSNNETSDSVCKQLGSEWSLPTDSQWIALTNAGATGWLGNKLGGLAYALPGARNTDGVSRTRTNYGAYWSSTESNFDFAEGRYLTSGSSDVSILNSSGDKSNGFSVLCIKN